jgi:hypothetical protein
MEGTLANLNESGDKSTNDQHHAERRHDPRTSKVGGNAERFDTNKLFSLYSSCNSDC